MSLGPDNSVVRRAPSNEGAHAPGTDRWEQGLREHVWGRRGRKRPLKWWVCAGDSDVGDGQQEPLPV